MRAVRHPHSNARGVFEPLAMVAILALALTLRLVYFQGVFSFDDFNYLRHAAEVWKLRFELADVLYWHGMRTLLFVPIGCTFALFGVSELTATLWPLLCALATIVVVFGIGRSLGGREAGIFAALALAILPIAVTESTKVIPGAILNLLTAIAVFAFVRAGEHGARRNTWLAVSGLSYALVPWAGHLGLVLGVFFPIALLLLRTGTIRSYAPLLFGFVLLIFVGVLLSLFAAGDPLANLHVARTVLDTETPTPRPFFYAYLMLEPLRSHGGVFLLSALGGILALAVPRRRPLAILLWFVATYLVIEFATTSLTAYRPMFKQPRYLSVLIVPGALLAGFALAALRRLAGKRLGSGVVAVALVATLAGSIATLGRATEETRARKSPLEAIGRIVRAHEGETIYVLHWLWNTRVGFWMEYDDAYFPSGYAPYQSVRLDKADAGSKNRYVQTITPGEALDPGILLVDERVVRYSIGPTETRLVRVGDVPSFLADPPAAWRELDLVEPVRILEIPGGSWPSRVHSSP